MSYLSACEICYDEESHFVCNDCKKLLGHNCMISAEKYKCYCIKCHLVRTLDKCMLKNTKIVEEVLEIYLHKISA